MSTEQPSNLTVKERVLSALLFLALVFPLAVAMLVTTVPGWTP